jgi:hypothetical protein
LDLLTESINWMKYRCIAETKQKAFEVSTTISCGLLVPWIDREKLYILLHNHSLRYTANVDEYTCLNEFKYLKVGSAIISR